MKAIWRTSNRTSSLLAIRQWMADRAAIDLSGEWLMETLVERTTYGPYNGMRLECRLFVSQNGREFVATGEKVQENGVELDHRLRTPIEMDGSINGQLVRATFVEQGLRRQTSGAVTLEIDPGKRSMTGTYTTTAASSSGRCTLI